MSRRASGKPKQPTCQAFAADDALSHAQQLHRHGVTVIPCLPGEAGRPCDMSAYRCQFDAAVASFPEYAEGATDLVMGGFRALGNPASFHNRFVRRLRQWAMHAAVTHLWAEYTQRYMPEARLEQCIDRMMLRPKGIKPSPESWHRDEAINALPKDHTFGGWVNLDDRPQYLNCVPGTHRAQRTQKGGFAPIKSAQDKARYERQCQAVAVPPGHMIVFFEHIVHEVRAKAAAYDMYRVFTGWRVTYDIYPLNPSTPSALHSLLQAQAVMPLKSGQIPPMYATLHWTNFRGNIETFTKANMAAVCQEQRRVKSGNDKDHVYRVVHRHMWSLEAYGMPKYPPYTPAEVKMHLPKRSWTVLVPGRQRKTQTVSLRT